MGAAPAPGSRKVGTGGPSSIGGRSSGSNLPQGLANGGPVVPSSSSGLHLPELAPPASGGTPVKIPDLVSRGAAGSGLSGLGGPGGVSSGLTRVGGLPGSGLPGSRLSGAGLTGGGPPGEGR